MQPDRFRVATYWLRAAEQDAQAAMDLAERMPNIACFHAQQAAEKALKAALTAVAGDTARSHLSDTLIGELRDLEIEIPGEVLEDAQALDKFYIAPRYPDALGGTDITSAFKPDEALRAIARAGSVVSFARALIEREQNMK